jgi:hypothetical protein
MTQRFVGFDDLPAKLTTLSSRAGLASREVRNLADGFHKLYGPLRNMRMAGGNLNIDPTYKTLIDDEWAALYEMTNSTVKELEPGFSQAEPKPSVIWLKTCLIKALFRAEKLCVLVDSVLRYPRSGWERLVVFVGNNESHQGDIGLLTLA